MQVIALKGPVHFLVGTIFHKAHNGRISYFHQSSFLIIHWMFIEQPEWAGTVLGNRARGINNVWASSLTLAPPSPQCLKLWLAVFLCLVFDSLPNLFELIIPHPPPPTHQLIGTQHVFISKHCYSGLPRSLSLRSVSSKPIPITLLSSALVSV